MKINERKIWGFTLLEVIIVITFFGIIMGGIFAYSRSALVSAGFHSVVYEIKHALLTSENYSRANFFNVKSGVAFDNNSYTVFFADTFSLADTSNMFTSLPNTVYLTDVSFGGDSEIYFDKYTGMPDAPGELTIVDESGREASIYVYTDGVIDINY